jgi:Fe-S-cluster-containing hydrogenase component 2
MQAQSLLLLDLEKCTRCDECVRGCADSHGGVTRLVREGLRFDKYLVATSCRSCLDPVCMIGCPVGSIRRKDSMEIIIEDWCIGCAKCANQCPYGNISMHDFPLSPEEQKQAEERDSVKLAEKAALPPPANAKVPALPAAEKAVAKKATVKTLAVTCDLCTELPEPNCVYACPHDAAHRVDARVFFEMGGEEATKKAKV